MLEQPGAVDRRSIDRQQTEEHLFDLQSLAWGHTVGQVLAIGLFFWQDACIFGVPAKLTAYGRAAEFGSALSQNS
jgi:hypothetical protein